MISFSKKCPELAKEAFGWDPSFTSYGSKKNKKWKCPLNHIYEARPNSRSSRGSGCPYCASKKILIGFNDLKSRFPKIANEAYGWDPSDVFPHNMQKRKWKCKNNHIYEDTPDHRTGMGTGCYFCSGKILLIGFNDLKTRYPDIAKQAHGWDPESILPGINKKYKWSCEVGAEYVLGENYLKEKMI